MLPELAGVIDTRWHKGEKSRFFSLTESQPSTKGRVYEFNS